MHMKSSHQIRLEMIEQTLHPGACFHLHAAKHKVLVIRDAVADDKEYCEALLLKIDHLLGQQTVPAVTRSADGRAAPLADSERVRSAA
jgi:hypothetical protein